MHMILSKAKSFWITYLHALQALYSALCHIPHPVCQNRSLCIQRHLPCDSG